MATIDSKKLLPPSRGTENKSFLVPVKNILPQGSGSFDIKRLKPADSQRTSGDGLLVVKKKIIKVTDLFKNRLLFDKKVNEKKRKDNEKEKSEDKEKKLESKDFDKKEKASQIIGSVPGSSIFDRLARFAGFTFLGFIFNNYGDLLPKLINLGKNLKPAIETFDYFAKGLVDNSIAFIEKGYEAYDKLREITKNIGGAGAAKIFDDFSGTLNNFLNYTLILAIAFRPPRRPPGGGAGSGFLAGLATGLGISRGRGVGNLVRAGVRSGVTSDLTSRILSRLPAKIGVSTRQRVSSMKPQKVPVGAGAGTGMGRGVPRIKEVISPKGSYFEITNAPSKSTRQLLRAMGTGATRRGQAASDAARDIRASEGYSDLAKAIGKEPKGMSWRGRIKLATKAAKFPIIGSIIDLAISTLVFREPLDSALVRSLGSSLGGFLGGIAGTFIPIPGAGTLIGATIGAAIGDWLANSLYQTIKAGMSKTPSYAQGGQVTRGGKRQTAPSRQIKRVVPKPKRVQPQKSQPGRDVGGIKNIEKIYGRDALGQKSALRVLKNTSNSLKGVSVLNGSLGNLMGASVDLAMGQKFDRRTIRSIGDQFGFAIQSMVDNQVSSSISDISKQIAMANGGVVPSRRIGEGLSVGARVSMLISNALSSMMETVSGRVLQSIMKELGLKGGSPSGAAGAPIDFGGGIEDFSGNTRAMKAYNYFKGQGYTDFQAAAIVGNLLQENRAMNPTLVNSIGMRGIAQWDATRWSNLERFAASKNLDPNSFETQLKFIQYELKTGSGGLRDSTLKAQKTLEDATIIFRKQYERPGEAEANDAARIKYARSVLASSKFEYVPPGNIKPTVTGRYGDLRLTGVHGGSDLAVPDGTPLRAISDGKIIEAGQESGWGNFVVFQDKDGIYHLYGHMQSNRRRSGAIKKGDIIGYVGMSGRTSGPHLHWETGTGWNGQIQNKFDPLNRYSINAPFSTQKDSVGKKQTPSSIYRWNQSSIAPTKPKSTDVAMNTSYSQGGMVAYENNVLMIQEIRTREVISVG